MRKFVFALACLVSLPASAAALSPEGIALQIKEHGAKAAVARLWNNDDYDQVMDKLKTGDDRWIALAPLLAPGTDADAGEDLLVALAFALPRNPRAVLTVLAGKQGSFFVDVCTVPFDEGTVKDISVYIKRARKAVAEVSDPALARTKAECLEQLRTATMP
jgi:hypothetical protein